MEEIKKIIENALDEAWEHSDLLPNINTRLYMEFERVLRQPPVMGKCDCLCVGSF